MKIDSAAEQMEDDLQVNLELVVPEIKSNQQKLMDILWKIEMLKNLIWKK
jgi:hypothetical protein